MGWLRRGLLSRFDFYVAIAMPLLDFFLVYAGAMLALALSDRFSGNAPDRYYLVIFFIAVVTPAWLERIGVYRPWRGQSLWSELHKVTFAWTGLVAALALAALLTKTGSHYSRLWMLLAFACSLLFLLAARVVLRCLINYFRGQGYNTRQVIVVGSRKRCEAVKMEVKAASWAGLEVADSLDFDTCNDQQILSNLADALGEKVVDQLWLAVDIGQVELINRIQRVTAPYPLRVIWVPDLLGIQLLNHQVNEIAGMPVVTLQGNPLSGRARLLKTLEDKVLATLMVILAALPMLLIAGLIKTTSRGPVFFVQKRHGISGRPIDVFKFRTMRAHKEGRRLKSAVKGDERVTPLGRFLRKTSLDELPQLFNVLTGSMSLVGPRPHSIKQELEFTEYYHLYPMRHKIKPGITGWAQINGLRGEVDSPEKLKKRVEHDLYYLTNWSIWLDIRIITLTLWSGWRSPNAY